jgi:uncharacterized membrane protein YkoI
MMARCSSGVVGGLFTAVIAGLLVAVPEARAQDKVDVGKIPKQVMETLNARFPKAEIHQATREKEGDNIVYDLEFRQDGRKFEADITESGTILNWEKEVAARDLPETVRKAVEKRYPKAALKEVMDITEVKDGKETREGYEIVLETADKKEVELTVAPDGRILEDSGERK